VLSLKYEVNNDLNYKRALYFSVLILVRSSVDASKKRDIKIFYPEVRIKITL